MISIGLEAGFDPGWLAGLQYVRNLTHTLVSLPLDEQPTLRLLPVDAESAAKVADLARYDHVHIAVPDGKARFAVEMRLKMRRVIRKVVQPVTHRVIDRAFKDLDVTYPGWGTPVPGIPQMHWVPDLQHVFLPEFFDAEEIRRRDADLRRLADLDTTLIFSSQSALQDFRSLFPVTTARTEVWRFCSPITQDEVDDERLPLPFDLPDRFLYVANQFWAHKDHMTLFKALVILREQGLKPEVVCTGLLSDRRNPRYVEEVRRFLRDNDLEGQVRILGVVDRAHQIEIFRRSAAVVQPSRFEGWSTVIEDAKAIGRPIIMSNFRVHLEQAPDGDFFELGSAEDLAEVLRRRWPDLRPGPEPESESLARRWLEQRRIDLARSFIGIASREVERHRLPDQQTS